MEMSRSYRIQGLSRNSGMVLQGLGEKDEQKAWIEKDDIADATETRVKIEKHAEIPVHSTIICAAEGRICSAVSLIAS